MNTQKVIVYIDGHNLLSGLLDAKQNHLMWLDLQKLANDFIQPQMCLAAVKYFTAPVKNVQSQKIPMQWQQLYHRGLTAHCTRLEIIQGYFLSATKKCPHCDNRWRIFKEKKTDVNIASHLLADAFTDKFDCCYVVSGDSDLTPPLEMLQKHHPQKTCFIACPPKRKSKELCQATNNSFFISQQMTHRCQLPPKIPLPSGGYINQPPSP